MLGLHEVDVALKFIGNFSALMYLPSAVIIQTRIAWMMDAFSCSRNAKRQSWVDWLVDQLGIPPIKLSSRVDLLKLWCCGLTWMMPLFLLSVVGGILLVPGSVVVRSLSPAHSGVAVSDLAAVARSVAEVKLLPSGRR